MSQALQPYDLQYTIVTDYGTLVLGDTAIPGNEVTAPAMWKENMAKWIRNEEWHGLFRGTTVPLKFGTKGKTLLDYVFAIQGSEAVAAISIDRLDRADPVDTWVHKKYFHGVIDFTQCKSSRAYFEANVVEGGLSQLVKANKDTKYDVNKAGYNLGLNWHTVVQLPNTLLAVIQPEYDFITYRSVVEALLAQMAGYAVPFYCLILDELEANGALLMWSNGRAVRNRAANAKNMTTTIQELFQFLNAWKCCGMGIEVIAGDDTLVIAERSYFYNDTQICETLPNTREIEITFAKGYLADSIKYGTHTHDPLQYPVGTLSQGDIDIVNTGMFNKTNYGAIPIKTAKKEIDASSEYYAEGKKIAMYRELNPDVLETEEDGDNDILVAFVQYIASAVNWEYSFYTGYTTELVRAFNTALSPKRCIDNWMPYINSITAGIVNVLPYPVNIEITLPEGVANSSTVVHSDYTADDSVEPVSVIINGTGQIFKPYIFKIKTAGTVDIVDIFEANHNGYISFYYKGVLLKGHIMEVAANPTRRKVLEMTLLAHKDTDLTDIFPFPVIAS